MSGYGDGGGYRAGGVSGTGCAPGDAVLQPTRSRWGLREENGLFPKPICCDCAQGRLGAGVIDAQTEMPHPARQNGYGHRLGQCIALTAVRTRHGCGLVISGWRTSGLFGHVGSESSMHILKPNQVSDDDWHPDLAYVINESLEMTRQCAPRTVMRDIRRAKLSQLFTFGWRHLSAAAKPSPL